MDNSYVIDSVNSHEFDVVRMDDDGGDVVDGSSSLKTSGAGVDVDLGRCEALDALGVGEDVVLRDDDSPTLKLFVDEDGDGVFVLWDVYDVTIYS